MKRLVRAAYNGHLECLKHAKNPFPWDEKTCLGLPKMVTSRLKYAHENGCPWDGETCSEAAENGHLECLKYATKTGVLGMKRLVLKLPKKVTSSV